MILPIGDDNPKAKVPWVHYGILAVNVLVYLNMVRLSGPRVGQFIDNWGLVPKDLNGVNLISSLYVHGSLDHIFGNMLFLWIVGDNVEDRLGHGRYFVFYHAAGVLASLVHVWINPLSDIPLVGASGAVSGVMGAYAVFFPRAKIKIWYFVIFHMSVAYVSAMWAVGLYFIYQVLFLLLAGARGGGGVAYGAHVGGLLFGIGVALILRKTFLKAPDTVRRIVSVGSGATGGVAIQPGDKEAWRNVQWLQPELGPSHGPLDSNAEIAAALTAGALPMAYQHFMQATSGYQPVSLEPLTLMRLGQELLLAGRYSPAARVYEVMVDTFPEDDGAPEAAFRLGTILCRELGDYRRARAYLQQALQTHRDAQRQRRIADELKLIDAHLRSTRLSRRRLGRVWIIRQTDEPVDETAIAQLAANTLSLEPLGVMTQLRASRGIIASDVPLKPAQTLAEYLQAMDVPVLLIPTSELIMPPPAARVRSITFSTHGARFEQAARVVMKAWRDAQLISCGCVESGGVRRRVVDFFFAEDGLPTHLRVREGEFMFTSQDAPGQSQRDIAAFCRILAFVAADVPMTPGVSLFDRPLDDAAWRPFCFDSEREFDQYNLWVLQLLGAGRMPNE
jgi:membrane associated rhomboid family serine protease/tetratricopeptide (TPR) repeat protein